MSLTSCLFAAPGYRGPKSPHFDGERFHNGALDEGGGWSDFWKWQRTRQRGVWRPYRDVPPGPVPPRRVEPGDLRVTYVNHATTLIQMDGVNILTDPIWSDRCSPVSFAGPRRVRPPGIRFEDLPPIDIVVVSHNHYDHMDVPTLRRLERAFHPKVFVGLGNAALLKSQGISSVAELDWWQRVQASPVTVVSVPTKHFSNRGVTDRNKTLWTGFALVGSSGYVYFAGDTAWGSHFGQVRERYGPPRLALLPIGAFRPEWFMGRVHETPEQAVEAHRALGASTSVAIHFGTFELGDDGEVEAVERLQRAIETAETPLRFWTLDFGEGREVPPSP